MNTKYDTVCFQLLGAIILAAVVLAFASPSSSSHAATAAVTGAPAVGTAAAP